MILSKKLDRVLDEFSPSAGVGYHRREPARAFVPTTDGQQGFQVLVVRFQAGELGVSTFERVNKNYWLIIIIILDIFFFLSIPFSIS